MKSYTSVQLRKMAIINKVNYINNLLHELSPNTTPYFKIWNLYHISFCTPNYGRTPLFPLATTAKLKKFANDMCMGLLCYLHYYDPILKGKIFSDKPIN